MKFSDHMKKALALISCLALLFTGAFPAASLFSHAEDSYVWNLTNGVLTLDCAPDLTSGIVPDFTQTSDRPWQVNASEITKVVVKGGITSVGSRAFSYLTNLSEIVLEEGVTALGCDCFAYNGAIYQVTLPASLVSIAQGAFFMSTVTYVCYPDSSSGFAGRCAIANYNETLTNAVWITGQMPEGEPDGGVSVVPYETGMENWAGSPNRGDESAVTQILFMPQPWVDAYKRYSGKTVTITMEAEGREPATFTTSIATLYDGSSWGIWRVEPCLMETPWIPETNVEYTATLTFKNFDGRIVTVVSDGSYQLTVDPIVPLAEPETPTPTPEEPTPTEPEPTEPEPTEPESPPTPAEEETEPHWVEGSSATVRWGAVEGANYYAVTVNVYAPGGETLLGSVLTGTTDTELDVQQEIHSAIGEAEYNYVLVSATVHAEYHENEDVTVLSEDSTADAWTYRLAEVMQYNTPTDLILEEDGRLSFLFDDSCGQLCALTVRFRIGDVYEELDKEVYDYGVISPLVAEYIDGRYYMWITNEVELIVKGWYGGYETIIYESVTLTNLSCSIRAVYADYDEDFCTIDDTGISGYIPSAFSEYSNPVTYTYPGESGICYSTPEDLVLDPEGMLTFSYDDSEAAYDFLYLWIGLTSNGESYGKNWYGDDETEGLYPSFYDEEEDRYGLDVLDMIRQTASEWGALSPGDVYSVSCVLTAVASMTSIDEGFRNSDDSEPSDPVEFTYESENGPEELPFSLPTDLVLGADGALEFSFDDTVTPPECFIVNFTMKYYNTFLNAESTYTWIPLDANGNTMLLGADNYSAQTYRIELLDLINRMAYEHGNIAVGGVISVSCSLNAVPFDYAAETDSRQSGFSGNSNTVSFVYSGYDPASEPSQLKYATPQNPVLCEDGTLEFLYDSPEVSLDLLDLLLYLSYNGEEYNWNYYSTVNDPLCLCPWFNGETYVVSLNDLIDFAVDTWGVVPEGEEVVVCCSIRAVAPDDVVDITIYPSAYSEISNTVSCTYNGYTVPGENRFETPTDLVLEENGILGFRAGSVEYLTLRFLFEYNGEQFIRTWQDSDTEELEKQYSGADIYVDILDKLNQAYFECAYLNGCFPPDTVVSVCCSISVFSIPGPEGVISALPSDDSEWSNTIEFCYEYRLPVEVITLSPAAPVICLGNSYYLGKMVEPLDAYYENITWSSADDSVVTIDENGMITGVAVGTADITATIDEVSATVTVTVYELSSNIENEEDKEEIVDTAGSIIDDIANNDTPDISGTDIDLSDLEAIKEQIRAGIERGDEFSIDFICDRWGIAKEGWDADKFWNWIEGKLDKLDPQFLCGYDIEYLMHHIEGDGTDHPIGNITEFDEEYEFSLEVPDDIPALDFGKGRKYTLVRYHDGEFEFIEFDVDKDGNIHTKSNKYSDFIIMYSDHKLSISDVSQLLNHLSTGKTDYLEDYDHNGILSITDVTALLDVLATA